MEVQELKTNKELKRYKYENNSTNGRSRFSTLRPHSLTVPKPLIPVAGQPIVHRLVKDIAKVLKQPIDEIAFVLGDPAWFGDDVVREFKRFSNQLGRKSHLYIVKTNL